MIGVLVLVILMVAGLSEAGMFSVEIGKQLFNDPGLGGSANEMSCNTCHPDGKGLGEAGDSPRLSRIIIRCLQGPLKGQSFSEGGAEMRSLKMYILSL